MRIKQHMHNQRMKQMEKFWIGSLCQLWTTEDKIWWDWGWLVGDRKLERRAGDVANNQLICTVCTWTKEKIHHQKSTWWSYHVSSMFDLNTLQILGQYCYVHLIWKSHNIPSFSSSSINEEGEEEIKSWRCILKAHCNCVSDIMCFIRLLLSDIQLLTAKHIISS